MIRRFFLLCAAAAAFSSTSRAAVADTLTEASFLGLVWAHHPLALQAESYNNEAAAYVMKARGAFDPKLSAGTYRKIFDGKTYYDLPTAGVTVPTRMGIQPFAEFVDPTGTALNPERSVPAGGQWAAGVKIPLAEGLFTDAARTELAKARAYVTANEAARRAQLNALTLEAAQAYWRWWKATQALEIAEEGLRLAETRADQIRSAHRLGDRPAIDTLEAAMQVDRRAAERHVAEADYAYAQSMAFRFLWSVDGQPALPSPDVLPQAEPAAEILDAASRALAAAAIWQADDHPDVAASLAKLGINEADLRLARNNLLPELDLSLAALSGEGGPAMENWSVTDQHLIGVKASVPMFLRTERGSLALAEIQLQQAQWTLDDKSAKYAAAVRALAQQIPAIQSSARLTSQVATGARTLLEAEITRLENGESSLFQVNYRENQYLKARKDAVERKADWAMTVREFEFFLGTAAP